MLDLIDVRIITDNYICSLRYEIITTPSNANIADPYTAPLPTIVKQQI